MFGRGRKPALPTEDEVAASNQMASPTQLTPTTDHTSKFSLLLKPRPHRPRSNSNVSVTKLAIDPVDVSMEKPAPLSSSQIPSSLPLQLAPYNVAALPSSDGDIFMARRTTAAGFNAASVAPSNGPSGSLWERQQMSLALPRHSIDYSSSVTTALAKSDNEGNDKESYIAGNSKRKVRLRRSRSMNGRVDIQAVILSTPSMSEDREDDQPIADNLQNSPSLARRSKTVGAAVRSISTTSTASSTVSSHESVDTLVAPGAPLPTVPLSIALPILSVVPPSPSTSIVGPLTPGLHSRAVHLSTPNTDDEAAAGLLSSGQSTRPASSDSEDYFYSSLASKGETLRSHQGHGSEVNQAQPQQSSLSAIPETVFAEPIMAAKAVSVKEVLEEQPEFAKIDEFDIDEDYAFDDDDDEDDEEEKEEFETHARHKSMERVMHKIFAPYGVTRDENLLFLFMCATPNRFKILQQGHMFVTQNHFCFHANIFGFQTSVVIPISEVVSVAPAMTINIIPNAVTITTVTGEEYFFTSFIARDRVVRNMRSLMVRIGGGGAATSSSLSRPSVSGGRRYYDGNSSGVSVRSVRMNSTDDEVELLEQDKPNSVGGIFRKDTPRSVSGSDSGVSSKPLNRPVSIAARRGVEGVGATIKRSNVAAAVISAPKVTIPLNDATGIPTQSARRRRVSAPSTPTTAGAIVGDHHISASQSSSFATELAAFVGSIFAPSANELGTLVPVLLMLIFVLLGICVMLTVGNSIVLWRVRDVVLLLEEVAVVSARLA